MIKKSVFFLLAILLVIGCFAGCGESVPTLNVLNWGDYMDPEVRTAFEEEFNCKVNYTTCTSNEEMYATVSTSGSKIDVIFPSDYLIERMIREDRLHKINYDNIPNAENLLDFCTDRSFDPQNQYSVPYVWGTVGILYNTKKVSEPIDSWEALWDEQYKDEIYMYDSVRDAMGITLAKLGYSINSREQAHLDEAKAELIRQKSLVKGYGTDDIRTSLINESGILGVVYSGDAVLAIDENPDLAYCIPKEGSNIWFDNITIMKDSPNAELAEQFINYLLRPDVSAKNSDYIGYPSANKYAIDEIDKMYEGEEGYVSLRENYAYNPPEEDLARCEVYADLNEYEKVYAEIWMAVRTNS